MHATTPVSADTKTTPIRRRTDRRAAVAALAVAASLVPALAGATPASAARSDVCPSGGAGCGSATWTWYRNNQLNPLSLSIRDTKCDGLTVKFSLRMGYADGSIHTFPPLTAGGCHDPNVVKNTFWVGNTTKIVWAQAYYYLDGVGSSSLRYGNKVYQ